MRAPLLIEYIICPTAFVFLLPLQGLTAPLDLAKAQNLPQSRGKRAHLRLYPALHASQQHVFS